MHAYASEAPDRRSAPICLGVVSVALAFLFAWLLDAADLAVPWWVDAPAVIGFYGGLYRLYDTTAWRWQLGPLRFSNIPDLAGVWQGEITSVHDDSVTHSAELRIRQTWSSMEVEFVGERSSSCSTMAALNGPGSARPGLTYEYLSEPRGLAPETMSIHRGVALLRSNPDGSLEGDYYTGRGRHTHGTMRFLRGGPRAVTQEVAAASS